MLTTLGLAFLISYFGGCTILFLYGVLELCCYIHDIINGDIKVSTYTLGIFGLAYFINFLIYLENLSTLELISEGILLFGAHKLRFHIENKFKGGLLSVSSSEKISGKETESSSRPSKVERLAECPVCFDVIKKNVYQCTNGHILCSDCYSKVQICPSCRITLSRKPIRNLILEQMISQI